MNGMDTSKIGIRKATRSDFDFFYKIKSEYSNIFWTGHKKPPSYEKLKEWYTRTLLHNDKKVIYIASNLGQDIGYLYIDIIEKDLIEIAIAISEKYQGKELGSHVLGKFLKIILHDYNKPEIVAWIFESNIASKRIFTKNAFIASQEIRKGFFPLKNAYETQVKYVYKGETH